MESKKEMKTVVDLSSRKPSAFQTFVNSFIKTDAKTFREWMWDDVIVPGVKGFILDSLSKIFFENDRYTSSRDPRRRSDREDYTRFSKYAYKSDREKEREREKRKARTSSSSIPDYRELPPMTPEEAADVIQSMRNALEDYNNVTVGAFYTLVGYKSMDPIDENYGWTKESFKTATTTRAPHGMVYLDIPDAEPL